MSHRKRKRHRFQRQTSPGSTPGVVAPDPDAGRPEIHVMAYGPDKLVERTVASVDELANYLAKLPVTWINVVGLGDAATILALGNLLGLHDLALEDVVNVHQRPKVEPYADHLFVVTRPIECGEDGLPLAELNTEQISMFLGKNYLLTLQERKGDCLESVRKRLRMSTGRLRIAGTDYLAYAILDACVDSYFPVLDGFADQLDAIELEVPELRHDLTRRLHAISNELLLLRRAVRPQREALNQLVRDEHELVQHETRVFLRDCYDHVVQVIDYLEVYRELSRDLRDYYLSLMSNRMNEVMKVLTIIATIFIPLSFIAGLYGMNFEPQVSEWNMPELRWTYGYPFALGLMASVASGLTVYFWRRGWLR